ncbi:hypothetical protein [Pokkaliibacter plantistimulans]|uniref:hypothetical protein n=1 Tax=Pokkaliibacter plantistimulans TaxID=1635171 RepID=UPI0026A91899|nr:hypothetical protein [Pokkaliibacter plantistimulans]
MIDKTALAIKVLTDDVTVIHGIFVAIKRSGFFPPAPFLNEFLEKGTDSCDQDGIMDRWTPFILSSEEYQTVLLWWLTQYPGTVVAGFGAVNWNEWVGVIVRGQMYGYSDL